MSKLEKYVLLFSIGATLYSAIEIIWRGFTHWTMAITGGVCFCGIYYTNEKLPIKSSTGRCAVCSLLITAVEFIAGVIVNLCMHLKVWDYSKQKFNILGQVCLLYSFFWFLLSYPALKLCNLIKEKVFC